MKVDLKINTVILMGVLVITNLTCQDYGNNQQTDAGEREGSSLADDYSPSEENNVSENLPPPNSLACALSPAASLPIGRLCDNQTDCSDLEQGECRSLPGYEQAIT